MSWFKKWFKNIVKPIFRMATEQAIDVGLAIATKAVIDVANDPKLVSGFFKDKASLDKARSDAWAVSYLNKATAAGIAIATGSALNLLRETALEHAKATGVIRWIDTSQLPAN